MSVPDSKPYFVGVDCGTGSVRGALLSSDGAIIATDVQPIKVWNPQEDFYEQSSEEIWSACCKVVKSVCTNVSPSRIQGIGFDATCSLVVLDESFKPVSVSLTGDDTRNIVMWMDHRAREQTTSINETKHPVLRYVGGTMSLEMQPPKLLWLKQNLKASCWDRAAHFFDLADYLSWRATGSLSRSLCTLVCKWTFQADADGKRTWDETFWRKIGLEDLTEDNYSKIGSTVYSPGHPIKDGLTKSAASELGLTEGTAVGTSLIDAHAGGVGMLGADVKGHNLPCENQSFSSRLALILGTSSCHMAINSEPLLVSGVWGPYYSIMVPEFWSSEGGQSITGKLIDHLIETHPAFNELKTLSEETNMSTYDYLNSILDSVCKEKDVYEVAFLGKNLHIWPDYHGNRSPLADSTLKGMISGLGLDTSLSSLAILYVAAIQSLALGTRHILETMKNSGHSVNTLFACGGLSKNPLFLRIHADVTGLPIVLPKETESVLVGSAMLGACASGYYNNLQGAMEMMSHVGCVVHPRTGLTSFYERKYKVFLLMVDHQLEYRKIMNINI